MLSQRLNEANEKVRHAIESRDRLQRDHKRATTIFQRSDKLMRKYISTQKNKIAKCQSYFDLRQVCLIYSNQG